MTVLCPAVLGELKRAMQCFAVFLRVTAGYNLFPLLVSVLVICKRPSLIQTLRLLVGRVQVDDPNAERSIFVTASEQAMKEFHTLVNRKCLLEVDAAMSFTESDVVAQPQAVFK